tara:strand:+ start:315 stop:509 length:195 start_codon:yes stop_codon:yes gene_type:complete
MSYKKQLKKRIKNFYPDIKIGKISLHGVSFKIIIKNPKDDLKQLEQELREVLSMPGLCLVNHGQ